MPSILIEPGTMVKTVSKQCQTVPNLNQPGQPFQQPSELHQKDLRINWYFVHIQGPVHEAVSTGGHVSGLKSNRRVLEVPQVELTPTCRYSSQTAV